MWDVHTGDAETGKPDRLLFTNSAFPAEAISPDGQRIASSGNMLNIQLRDAVTGAVWQIISGHYAAVNPTCLRCKLVCE